MADVGALDRTRSARTARENRPPRARPSPVATPDGAPLHDWAGLGQRAIILLALFPARVALSIRLLKIVAQGTSTDPVRT